MRNKSSAKAGFETGHIVGGHAARQAAQLFELGGQQSSAQPAAPVKRTNDHDARILTVIQSEAKSRNPQPLPRAQISAQEGGAR
ncbi:hypothetical protein HPL003_16090 [Paenibacillus terrae HPL-003]|uniref:Uncharacterized protein n=1 Tax=Paenibacillus terrae (strain HPL-003) TaxID=985665 RepID=G7W0M9_PAETH|nr:hypothetical protein HPL003_16090 [Paenibacillus terrae HPL-003]